MRQARTVLSTYSADAFGVCSALYELGGMTVMHDASGCNSTYTTHDEPRWYHSDSLVFISGLTEMDAILGNDGKLIEDMLEAIEDLHPAFAALTGTPIPMMTGFDYDAVASELEQRSGIPCFGFPTNGMRSYLCGASEALAAFAERMTEGGTTRKRSVNILGATPLDFSISPTLMSIRRLLKEHGWEIISCFAMDSTLDDLKHAGQASVNLVISGVGMKAAQILKRKYGTPYVIGTPTGEKFSERIMKLLETAEEERADLNAFSGAVSSKESRTIIIGEPVTARSLAAAVFEESGMVPRVIDPLEDLPELKGVLSEGDLILPEEEEIISACRDAGIVIADPLYRPVLPKDCRFIPLPHEAFSGRMFRKEIPDLTTLKLEL